MSHDENNNKYKMVQNPSVLCLFNTTEFFITSAAVFMCSHVLEGTEMFVFVFYAFDTVCYNHKASKFNSTVILMGFKSQQALFGGVKNPPEMHLTVVARRSYPADTNRRFDGSFFYRLTPFMFVWDCSLVGSSY